MSTENNNRKKKAVTGWQRELVLRLDYLIYWFSKHWLAIFNGAAALYVGLPILAPVLMHAGLTGPGQAIYRLYSPMCHQMASRSFFLFGEQPAYPLAAAGTDLQPIEAYMDDIPEFQDISPDDWLSFTLASRAFIGNERMGYKMALCERDIAIYGFVFLGGLIFAGFRRRWPVKPLPLLAFAIIGVGPIGIDGFSQLFGYYATLLDGPVADSVARLFPLRESTPFLRVFTGGWFGLTLVWLAYPHLEQGMKDTHREAEDKLRRTGRLTE